MTQSAVFPTVKWKWDNFFFVDFLNKSLYLEKKPENFQGYDTALG